MTSEFVVIECCKCSEVRNIRWPFHNVLKLYCDCCNKCDEKFRLSADQRSSVEISPKEIIRREDDIPAQLWYTVGAKKLYCSYFFECDSDEFCWYHLDKEDLKFPLLLLDYGTFLRRKAYTVSSGIVLMKDVEHFLNKQDFV